MQMPRMLMLSNGIPETILSPMDFKDLIDERMETECANYYQNQIEELLEIIRGIDTYVDEALLPLGVKEVLKEYGY